MTFNSKLNRRLRLSHLEILKVVLVLGIMTCTPGLTHAQWTTPNAQGHINNTNTGNVGVGTTSPQRLVTLFDASLPVLQLGNTSSGSTANDGLLMFQYGLDSYLENSEAGSFHFRTNGNNRMTITSTGNVGIGTTSPGVGGIGFSSYMTLASSSGSRPVFEFVSNNGDHVGSEAGFLDFIINTNSAGHKSIGLITFETEGTTPNQRGGVMRLFTKANAGAGFERMRINSSGNVGINTTSPTYRLDVNGEINATGLRINGSPISNGPDAVSSVFGRTGTVVAATNDYTWGQINKTTSSLGDLTTRSAGDLSSGTLPDARFPSTLPVVSGANLTNLNASNLTGGTVATARLGSGTANSTTFLRGDNTWAAVSGGPSQWTTADSNIFYNTGNVGIGTTSPAFLLDVSGSANNPFRVRDSSGREYFSTETRGTFPVVVPVVSIAGGRLTIDNNGPEGGNDTVVRHAVNSLIFKPSDHPDSPGGFMVVQAGGNPILYAGQNVNGNVGIGTNTPSAKLEVAGNVNVTGTGNITAAGTIEGGNIKAKYQDVAEWVESSQELSAGTLVVLDHTKSNQVIASTQAYDTRVAGVISERPGIALGESGDNKLLVATTGRVRMKVDASRAPIRIGDLLVTSDIPGVAMKSQPINVGGAQLHRPGTIIGKKLEPLAKGTGEILVLLSLQ